MNQKLEQKIKSITEKLLESRKKHVGTKKTSSRTASKISRSLEDSLRGKDEVLSQASHSQRMVLDRVMMETFEFLGDPEKEVDGYKKILLEQLERIHAVNDRDASPEAEKEIIKIIEKQINSAKEFKIPELGIGKAIGGVFFNESFFKDLDSIGDKFEKMISGGGLFGSTKKRMEQATLRGKAAREMKDIGLRDPFHTHRHSDERYYRTPPHGAYYGANQSAQSQKQYGTSSSSVEAGGSKGDMIMHSVNGDKPPVDDSQSSYKMKSERPDVTDVEAKRSNASLEQNTKLIGSNRESDVTDVEPRVKQSVDNSQSIYKMKSQQSDVEPRIKPSVDSMQSSYKMKSTPDVTDVEPRMKKSVDNSQSIYKMKSTPDVTDVEPKPFRGNGFDSGKGEMTIQKLNVEKLLAQTIVFPKQTKNQQPRIQAKIKPQSLLGFDRKQGVTDAIIKKEIPARLEGLKDNEGDRMDVEASKTQQEGSGGVLGALSDAGIASAGKSLLGTVGKVAKGAASFALPAAAAMAAGAGVDSIAGKLGVGGKEINQQQDDANWDRMTWTQKIESGLARGTEKIGSALFLDNFSNEAKAKRIKTESEYLNKTPGVSISNVKSAEAVADQVEKSADNKMETQGQSGTTVIDNSSHTVSQGGKEKKADIPPAPASSRPTESTFSYWQRSVFLK